MKNDYIIPLIIVIGMIALFFFPEPETNFFAYVGTALFFTITVIVLIIKRKKINK